jgi:hypothetical protein
MDGNGGGHLLDHLAWNYEWLRFRVETLKYQLAGLRFVRVNIDVHRFP